MDLMPSVLDLCGKPENFDGRSMIPALSDEPARETRSAFLLEFHGIRHLYSQRAIVTDDGWKYVFSPADRDEVYNLVDDPAEMTNLIESERHEDIIERHRNELLAAVVEANDPLTGAVHKLLGKW